MRAPSMSTISNVKPFHSSFRPWRNVGQWVGIRPLTVVGVAGQGVFQTEPVEKVVERALPVDQTALPSSRRTMSGSSRGSGSSPTRASKNVAQGDDAARHAEFVADDAVAQLPVRNCSRAL